MIDVTLVVEATDPDQVITPDGVWLTPDAIHHLVCAAMFAPLIVTDTGDPLAMGRAIRAANRPQRRALADRDGGCVFPGCGAPVSWCDAHHVIHWEHDGPTDIDNLALLCRYHHGVTHRPGWTMIAHPDQTFTWTTPSGHTLHSQRHHGRQPRAG